MKVAKVHLETVYGSPVCGRYSDKTTNDLFEVTCLKCLARYYRIPINKSLPARYRPKTKNVCPVCLKQVGEGAHTCNGGGKLVVEDNES